MIKIDNQLTLDFNTIKLFGLIIISILLLLNTYTIYGGADEITCENLVCTFKTHDKQHNPLEICFLLTTNQSETIYSITNQD